MKKLFLNWDGHLRSTLQIVAFSMIFLSGGILGQGVIANVLHKLIGAGVLPESIYEVYFLTGILPEVFINLLAAGIIICLYKLFNKKSVKSMGLYPVWKQIPQILSGMGLFMVVLAVITGILFITGNIRFTGIKWDASIFQYILLMASVSFVEEVLNRGAIQHLVARRSYVIVSLLVPSLVFMSFHIMNPGITVLSLVNIFLAGFFFSLVTYQTKSIWFGFGAHLVWNVGCACVFGIMQVSAVTGSVLNFEYVKSNVLNGYGQGPLSGVIGTFAYIVLIVIFGIRCFASPKEYVAEEQ